MTKQAVLRAVYKVRTLLRWRQACATDARLITLLQSIP